MTDLATIPVHRIDIPNAYAFTGKADVPDEYLVPEATPMPDVVYIRTTGGGYGECRTSGTSPTSCVPTLPGDGQRLIR